MSKSKLADTGIVLAQVGQKIAHAVVDNGGTDSDTKTVLSKEGLVKDIAMLILGKVKVVVIEVAKILRLVESGIVVPTVTETFVVADHFRVNIGSDVFKPWKKGEVKISYIGDDFEVFFLCQEVSVRDGQFLSCYQLTQNTYDMVIRKELGAGIETDFASLWSLLEQQPEGDEGVLRNDGYTNIFYITDKTGVVRAVYARWRCDGWCVFSDVLNSSLWIAGRQVFSRNSGN
jgi:hypothetical protein